ncbi:hypothetical protein JQ607_27015 [Bradyrhizobium liaoningense]|uniref:hypothetical protein n=1 Tax=Bradyrhizobium liaoningense TaxID=43992 RepID=UPI001BA4E884|nr:hypothetical protein [Bradyrhizobium liaoningense]MBR0843862.1 hypothetical protein [Bradyrhizobium liaoningense]
MRWLTNRIKIWIDGAAADAVAKAMPKPEPKVSLPALDILVEKHGYGRTLQEKVPVAADGSPIPWYTYPAVEFFGQLDARGLRIFEFGCGNSSLFWAHKGAEVFAVEHDRAWFEKMSAMSVRLRQLVLRESAADYARAIADAGDEFDIIIIDGAWRNECARAALPHLRKGGCIILDNSDWYIDVAEFLRTREFLQIDFSGFGPINNYCWTTSLLVPATCVLNAHLNHPRPIGGVEVGKGATW